PTHVVSILSTETDTTAIESLSLHDALPICCSIRGTTLRAAPGRPCTSRQCPTRQRYRPLVPIDRPLSSSGPARSLLRDFATRPADRKSTRLNSSHVAISYAVFCLKKKISNI